MKIKSILAMLISFSLLFGIVACTSSTTNPNTDDPNTGTESSPTPDPSEDTTGDDVPGELTTITFPTYKSGENVAADFMKRMVQAFNETYVGKYEVVIEEVTGEIYPDKMIQMSQQKMLPALIHMDIGRDFIDNVAIPQGWLYDISDWFATSGLKDVALEGSVEYCTTEDGAMYIVPGVVNNYIGLFYNSKLYDPGEKSVGEMSVEEWIDSLGDNKLALMTGENSWTTGLLFSAILANQPGGLEILNADYRSDDVEGDYLYDFNQPAFIETARIIQYLFQNHGSDNAVGAAYADAANNFMSGKSAFIFNGTWMNGEFAEAGKENWSGDFNGTDVAADIYPGNVAHMGEIEYGEYAVVAEGHTQAEIDAALAFVDFMYSPEWLETQLIEFGGIAPNYDPSEEFYTALADQPLLLQQQMAVNDDTVYFDAIWGIMPQSMEMVFSNLLTSLATNSITPEQFANQLTEEVLATRE